MPTNMEKSNAGIGRWLGVFALFFLIVIAYVDRINISVMIVNSEFLSHFNIDGVRIWQGSLMTAFLIGYGLSAFFLTPVFESLFHYKKVLTLSVFFWAILCAISPLMGSMGALLFIRFLLGVSEGPLFSLKTIYINDHFSAKDFGKANAITALGVSVGLAVGFPFISYLMSAFGWKMSFWVLAGINLCGGLLLIQLFIHPADKKQNTQEKEEKLGVRETLMTALKTPRLIWILLIEIATLSYLWGASSWLPAWLMNEHGFSLKNMGFLASLPFILSIFSKYAGGILLDKMQMKYSALIFVIGGILTASCIVGLMLTESIPWMIFFLLAANICWGFQGPAIPTLIQYHAQDKAVGSAYGVVNGVGNLFSAFIPLIMGGVMTSYGSVTAGFVVLVISQILTFIAGAILLMLMVTKGIPK